MVSPSSLSQSFLSLFAALNEMEEVAQEDGVAMAESRSEASATNQALLPMEVDEEQAGNLSGSLPSICRLH